MPQQTHDPFNLARYVQAQSAVYDTALAELRAGCKETHWMWFIFPQVAGLGSSSKAKFYAIRSRGEAASYLAHPILGKRLQECAIALLQSSGRSAEEIMGYPDCLKLQSSMTLFAEVAGAGSEFENVLNQYFAGQKDVRTLAFLS